MKPLLFVSLFLCLFVVQCTGLVFLTPNPIYNLSDWRNKYSPIKVPSAALTVSDCAAAYRTRSFLEPLTIRFYCNRGSEADCHATAPTDDVPIVVISSNRSKWIARTFAQSSASPDSALFYDPARANNKPIFVFVNALEFDTYSENLRNSSVRVIGCQGTAHPLSHSTPLNAPTKFFGFGFSRYCAFVFFRKVHHYRKLWMVDDNLRAITHLPTPSPSSDSIFSSSSPLSNQTSQLYQQLSTVEQILESKRLAAIGFSTGSYNVHLEDFNSDSVSYREHSRAAPCDLEPLPDLGFLEQAYLFNREEMDGFSFSPKFILSKEDMSFTRVLSRNRAVKRYSGAHLYKYRIDASQLDNPSGMSRWDFSALTSALDTIHATWSSPIDVYRFEDGSVIDFVEQSAKLTFVPLLSGLKSPTRTISNRGSEPWFKYGIKAVDAILRACSWREEPEFTAAIEPEFKDSIPLHRVSITYR